jgi:hypothetical protein
MVTVKHPKCRKKKLYGAIRKFLGPVFHELASQKFEKQTIKDYIRHQERLDRLVPMKLVNFRLRIIAAFEPTHIRQAPGSAGTL